MQRRKVDSSLSSNGGGAATPSSSSLPLHNNPSSAPSRPSRKAPTRSNNNNSKKKSTCGPIQVFIGIMVTLIILMVSFTVLTIMSHSHPTNDVSSLVPAEQTITFDHAFQSQQENVPVSTNSVPKRTTRRTSAEATAAMERHPSHNVDGEKALRAKLYPLYELQKLGKELESQIVTRWLGRSDLEYFFAKSKQETEKEAFQKWQVTVEEEREGMKIKDIALNPSLYNLADAQAEQKEEEKLDKGDEGGLTKTNDTSGTDIKSIQQFTNPAPENTHVSLEPTFGKHRAHADAIFAFAEGYDLKIYLTFLESLKATGYNGDLVLSVSALDKLKPGVEEYLRSHHKEENEIGLNVVVYTVTWICYTGDGKQADGANEGQRMCELVGMYSTDDGEAVKDPREPRPVATARYELYWAWSLQYDPHNWLMLIDSRDAFFQTDPFASLERTKDASLDNGLLYFFGENANASNIGQSPFNSRWLNTAYGKEAVKPFFDKPIVCSGSTMGEQIAIESYLRAMVEQFDKTKCKQKGCDQGFHNYLYYSDSLSGVQGIRDVVFFDQGKGIINNLGVLRKKPLKEWGLLDDKYNVLNWDKSVSPVAHQFDRDDELNKYIKGLRRQYETKYNQEKKERVS